MKAKRFTKGTYCVSLGEFSASITKDEYEVLKSFGEEIEESDYLGIFVVYMDDFAKEIKQEYAHRILKAFPQIQGGVVKHLEQCIDNKQREINDLSQRRWDYLTLEHLSKLK